MQISLVYPHQLFLPHPALELGRIVYLVEDPLFFGTDSRWPMRMHQQKLVLHFASMAAYAEELRGLGYEVRWIRLPKEPVSGEEFLSRALPAEVGQIHIADVADDVLERRIRRDCVRHGKELVIHPSPNFLTPPDFLERFTGKGAKPFMARFYRAQRERMGILLDRNGGPLGGKWSFDEENRRKWPKGMIPPEEPRIEAGPYVREAMVRVEREFADNPGQMRGFRWAVTRSEARCWLEKFFTERYRGFGPYEDAIHTGHAYLHHSAITPMLNIGLLDPAEVVSEALAFGESEGVPMASVEGFVRQLIGWREFTNGIYRHRSVEIRNGNHWGFTRLIPQPFYDGTTGIAPIDRVIRNVLEHGYCHHIERLMVLGSFFLLCRFHPDAVYRWFMEMFVDSYDWVMVPNVYGMSQFADRGSFTTKPYLCGSHYLLKMSNETRGDWCSVWDALYWSFVADHSGFFLANPRLSMTVRAWEKMDSDKKRRHRAIADDFLRSLR